MNILKYLTFTKSQEITDAPDIIGKIIGGTAVIVSGRFLKQLLKMSLPYDISNRLRCPGGWIKLSDAGVREISRPGPNFLGKISRVALSELSIDSAMNYLVASIVTFGSPRFFAVPVNYRRREQFATLNEVIRRNGLAKYHTFASTDWEAFVAGVKSLCCNHRNYIAIDDSMYYIFRYGTASGKLPDQRPLITVLAHHDSADAEVPMFLRKIDITDVAITDVISGNRTTINFTETDGIISARTERVNINKSLTGRLALLTELTLLA